MKKFKKIYIEITNICNLSCDFCPETKRQKQSMSASDFKLIATKLRPYGDYLYLHVKGEPTLHKELSEILSICESLGYKVCITTNGTLLREKSDLLLQSPAVHKVHISLHSFEASMLTLTLDEYLDNIIYFLQKTQCLTVLRLWNSGGADVLNDQIYSKLHQSFTFLREDKINDRTYIEHGEKFEWASLENSSKESQGFCYALRDQIAVLVDGTVVPCCLDNDGTIALGNIYEQDLETIYHSPRAKNLYNSFSNRCFSEELCKTCGFAKRFS
ncbi:MAG: radical SAM protein [Lachnospiraceae bacterium]